jgi:hypothetical protein
MKEKRTKVVFYDEKGRLVAPTAYPDIWRVNDKFTGTDGIAIKFMKGKTHIEVLFQKKDLKKWARQY